MAIYFAIRGIDSINMWGLISGVQKISPRQEIPHCINHPLYTLRPIHTHHKIDPTAVLN